MAEGLNDPDPRKRLTAALTLAERGDFSGLSVIEKELDNADGRVRLQAAACCEKVGFPSAADRLMEMATSDSETDNRNVAMYALVAIGLPKVVSALIAALDDEDPDRRDDARAALYQILGRDVLPLTADGMEADPEERARVASWWGTRRSKLDPDRAYGYGELASPGVFIAQLQAVKSGVPDVLLNALRNWTGQDFGDKPLSKVRAQWKQWWEANASRYEAGRRTFHGHRVPGHD